MRPLHSVGEGVIMLKELNIKETQVEELGKVLLIEDKSSTAEKTIHTGMIISKTPDGKVAIFYDHIKPNGDIEAQSSIRHRTILEVARFVLLWKKHNQATIG